MKARRLQGRGGFVVLWHATDANNYNRWTVGGMNNTARCEAVDDGGREAYGSPSPFTVETNRWYDLRVEVSGHHARAFVDGKLLTDATDKPHVAPAGVFASATYVNSNHIVIVKIVNVGKNPVDMALNLRGAGTVEPKGAAWVLSGDPKAANTVEEPTNIAPREEAVTDASASFHRSVPPHSFTLMRLTASPR